MNAFEIRFGRHGLHYMIFFGSMYFWAAVSKDVVLGWSLTVARFSIGILHLLAVFGDHSMSKAFLAFAIPDIITALLAARWLPSYKKAFPKRCRSPDLKSAHILLAFISIMTAVLHITGTIQFNQIYGLISRQISFGAFPVIPNSGYALSPQVCSSSLFTGPAIAAAVTAAASPRRWGRFLMHAILVHGLMHLHAAHAGDVGLARKLAAGRFLIGALDLLAVHGDASLAPAFQARPAGARRLPRILWRPASIARIGCRQTFRRSFRPCVCVCVCARARVCVCV